MTCKDMLKTSCSALRSVFRSGLRSGPAVCGRRLLSKDAIKEHDEKLYGGRKSFDIVFSEAKAEGGRRLIGRWDWHLWQFILSLVPAGGIYMLAQWARQDMQQTENAPILKKKKPSQSSPPPTATPALSAQGLKNVTPSVEKRLDSIELAIKNLQDAMNQRQVQDKEKYIVGSKSTMIQQPTNDQTTSVVKGPVTEPDTVPVAKK